MRNAANNSTTLVKQILLLIYKLESQQIEKLKIVENSGVRHLNDRKLKGK